MDCAPDGGETYIPLPLTNGEDCTADDKYESAAAGTGKKTNGTALTVPSPMPAPQLSEPVITVKAVAAPFAIVFLLEY